MTAQRVFVDTGILILASKAKEDEISRRAIEELDREAEFLFSSIVELETLPKPTCNNYPKQAIFLRTFFEGAERIDCTAEVQQLALVEACKDNLGACDALHVACAITGKADELLTHESPDNSLPKATGIQVRTIAL